MDSIQIYNYYDNIVAISDSKRYIIKTGSSFYYPTEDVFFDVLDAREMKKVRTIRDNPFLAILMYLSIIVSIVFYFIKASYVLIDTSFLTSLLILFFNIFIHECAHILVLKLFFPESRVKIGFKMVFIYPAFYVDTSYSYFLPKYKRIAVYTAGNAANSVFILLTLAFFPQLKGYLYLVISNMLINFLPIVKSDGYYAVLSFFDIYAKARSKHATFVENFIRGMLMFIVLELLSILL